MQTLWSDSCAGARRVSLCVFFPKLFSQRLYSVRARNLWCAQRAGTLAAMRLSRIHPFGLLVLLAHSGPSQGDASTQRKAAHGRDLLHCVLRESQTHEDIVLIPLLLEAAAASSTGSHRYSFTEIGAFDGFTESQTWLLDKCFGWHGVLIEASPQNFAQLNATHRSKHSVKVHSAACNGTGSVTVLGGGGTVAGVADDFARSFAKKWSNMHTNNCGGMPCKSEVACRPLPSIIADAGFPHVTFLSLDVEGGEERVLHTVAWQLGTAPGSFPFDVVMVEADVTTSRRTAVSRRCSRTGGCNGSRSRSFQARIISCTYAQGCVTRDQVQQRGKRSTRGTTSLVS